MSDLKLDPGTGDLAIEDHSLVLATGVEAIAQDCRVRLKFFLGEWFLDTRLGVPYYQRILGKKPRLPTIRSIFRKVILTTPGIINVSDLVVDFELRTRKLSVSFRAISTEGSFTFDEELII